MKDIHRRSNCKPARAFLKSGSFESDVQSSLLKLAEMCDVVFLFPCVKGIWVHKLEQFFYFLETAGDVSHFCITVLFLKHEP